MNLEDRQRGFIGIGKLTPAAVNPFVTRIMGVPKDGSPHQHRGSGLLCTIGGREAIVTANHVIEEIEEDGRFSGPAFSCFERAHHFTPCRLLGIDVAVYFAESRLEPRGEKQFWQGERSDSSSDLLLEDFVVFQGFPARFSRYSAFGPAHVSDAFTHCTSMRPKRGDLAAEVLANLDESTLEYPLLPNDICKPGQFALSFNEAGGPLMKSGSSEVLKQSTVIDYSHLFSVGATLPGQKPKGPFGISGSPVWRCGAYECQWNCDAWSAELMSLTGIVTHWNEAHKILLATSFAEILRSLKAQCAVG
jgi:hypothetical protein